MKSIEKMREWANSGKLYDNATRFVLHFADEIEAELAENYMLVPKDADGVPVHVGDMREWNGGRYEVMAVDKEHVWFDFDPLTPFKADLCRHVKPDPLKELLCDMIHEYGSTDALAEAVAEKYAERIRELKEVDR